MYNVMIVDDEIYLTVLISKLVHWEDFDMKVSAICYDGEAAYQRAVEEHFDLIILDVRMPGYDGLELMEKLRHADASTHYVVISGHKSFEYAQSALQNNAEGYLLKPIIREELEEILRRVRGKLDTEHDNASMLQRMRTDYEVANSRMRRSAMEYILERRAENLPETLQNRFGLELKNRFYLPIILTLDVPQGNLDKGNIEQLLARLATDVHAALEKDGILEISTSQDNSLIMLVNYEDPAFETRGIIRLEGWMRSALSRLENIVGTISVGRTTGDPAAICECIDAADTCRRARCALGCGGTLRETDIRSNASLAETLYEEYRESLVQAIRGLRGEKLCDYMREMMLRGNDVAREDSLILERIAQMLLRELHNYLVGVDACHDTFEKYCAELNHELNWACNVGMYIQCLENFFNTNMQAQKLMTENGENPAIRVAKLYISEHFAEDIPLSLIAKIVNLNQFYFSMLFKREVGVNFLEYLNNYRIKEAKKLLKDINYNINEVSYRCGFDNPKYFSQVFKKSVGITPTEYRKRHSNTESI